MAAYTDQPSRSRRFIRLYLAVWAFMAVAALGYLGLLAFQPQHGAAPKTQAANADPNQAMRALAKTAMEMGTMRRNLSDIQNDVAQLKEAAAQREAEDKAMATRLSAVEERLASLQPADPADAPRPKVSERNQRRMADARAGARVINIQPDTPAQPPLSGSAKDEGPPVPLVTGSIGRKDANSVEEVTFGEPVVKRAGAATAFAVQLAASPSLQGLRQSWGQLRERHGVLAALEPRVAAPRNEGGPYRLLAGPFATKADADRVCSDMGVGRNGCYVTTYTGAPL
jgi:hypothetical protein